MVKLSEVLALVTRVAEHVYYRRVPDPAVRILYFKIFKLNRYRTKHLKTKNLKMSVLVRNRSAGLENPVFCKKSQIRNPAFDD